MRRTRRLIVWLIVLVGMRWFARAQQIDAPRPVEAVSGGDRAATEGVTLPVRLAAPWFYAATDAEKTQKKTRTASGPPKPMKPRQIDPSMVGYIDDATLGNEVRIRFDAGFNTPRPDRAEYFYAGSTSPAPASSAVQRTLNFQELYLSGEYAPFKMFSAFVMVPFRWIEPFFISAPGQSPDLFSGGGVSDVQAGVKVAAINSGQSHVTLQLQAAFPTGDGANGFGTNHYSIEPMVLFFHQMTDRWALEGEAGDSHPIGGTYYTAPPAPPQKWSADVAMYGLGESYRLVDRGRYTVAPVLELVAWHVFGGLQTGANNAVQSAAGINVFNAKLGGRLNFGSGNSIYAGYGRGITSDIWYRNLFRIEYRKAF